MNDRDGKLSMLIGLSIIGGSITGAISFVAALFPLVVGDYAAVGLCLIAAALSFGLLANAVLRG
jgi:hypothetical protein